MLFRLLPATGRQSTQAGVDCWGPRAVHTRFLCGINKASGDLKSDFWEASSSTGYIVSQFSRGVRPLTL